jgi:ATP-binding cassette subfamily B protein
MAATRGALNYWYSIAVGELIHLKLVPELRTRVFDKLQRLSFRFFDENASGSIINRVTGDVQSVRSFVDGVLLQGTIMILSLAVYVAYMARTHTVLTLACLCLTPLLWIATSVFARWARPLTPRTESWSTRWC